MKKNIYIAVFGILGALARYGMKTAPLFANPWHWPLATLATNIIGSFLIAFIFTTAYEYIELPIDWRLGLTTGFLGAFTTFSTLCKEIYLLITGGRLLEATLYTSLSLGIGFFAIALGIQSARLLFKTLNIVRKGGA